MTQRHAMDAGMMWGAALYEVAPDGAAESEAGKVLRWGSCPVGVQIEYPNDARAGQGRFGASYGKEKAYGLPFLRQRIG